MKHGPGCGQAPSLDTKMTYESTVWVPLGPYFEYRGCYLGCREGCLMGRVSKASYYPSRAPDAPEIGASSATLLGSPATVAGEIRELAGGVSRRRPSGQQHGGSLCGPTGPAARPGGARTLPRCRRHLPRVVAFGRARPPRSPDAPPPTPAAPPFATSSCRTRAPAGPAAATVATPTPR